jgi:chitin synthase
MNSSFSTADIIKLVITSVSFIDFLVFCVLFLSFIILVPYKTKLLSTKIISICVIIFFICFKLLFIPIFLSTIPFFQIDIQGLEIILGILTWSNIILAAVPLVFAIISIVIYKTPNHEILIQQNHKKVNIIMPIYNEDPESLWRAIESVIKLDYGYTDNQLATQKRNLINLYLSFDEGVPKLSQQLNSNAFVKLMERFNLDIYDRRERINVDIDGTLIAICRFEHGGKKSAQYGGFKEMEKDMKILEEKRSSFKIDESLVFFIDSDIILKSDSLLQFYYYLERFKKNALTGLISCIASENPKFITFYQDIEYVSGQIFWRNLESYFNSTTCLPGAFTILRYSFFKKVSEKYFNSNVYQDNTDYQRFYLGEDRYLTHLLMEIEPGKLGFCEAARCKTLAPDNIKTLLKQRRRWYLGHIANDTWMISSLELWKNYPLLCLFNLLNNTRNTSIYIYLLYFVLLLNKEVSLTLWILFILLPIMCNWFFIVVYSFKIKRKMNMIFYIAILLFQPLFSMAYLYYTIWTIRTRSWGGPRIDNDNDNDKTRKREVDNVEEIYIENLEPKWSFDNESFNTCEISYPEPIYNPDEIQIVIQ